MEGQGDSVPPTLDQTRPAHYQVGLPCGCLNCIPQAATIGVASDHARLPMVSIGCLYQQALEAQEAQNTAGSKLGACCQKVTKLH